MSHTATQAATTRPDLIGVRGWLLVLCLLMLVGAPVVLLVRIGLYWPGIVRIGVGNWYVMAAGALSMLIDAAVIALGSLAGYRLWTRTRGAVQLAKSVLLLGIAAAALVPVLWLWLAEARLEMQTAISLVGTVIVCTIWFSYLTLSARVGSTYPKDTQTSIRLLANWSDPGLRAIVWQVVIVWAVVVIISYLVGTTASNLAARQIATGFDFLNRMAGIPIGESMLAYDPATDTYGTALIIGILNTLRVAVVGIVLATLLGTVIGIGRLSRNWLLAKLAAVYVETMRNVPLLLHLLFWYALLLGLPGPRQALRIGDSVFLSNRGIELPALIWEPAHSWASLAFAAGLVALWVIGRWAARRQAATGIRPHIWPFTVALLFVLPALTWSVLGAPWAIERPTMRSFNFEGASKISPEYGALLIGLVIYTAGFIAEIVRAGIQAVPHGQWEAARAVGLRHGTILRQIVLPQALRVIIPPMTSQYLNITKNSSLAVAIGYQDVVSIANTVLNQTGQAIEGIAYIMAVYLTISLSISLFMNWYNARVALVER